MMSNVKPGAGSQPSRPGAVDIDELRQRIHRAQTEHEIAARGRTQDAMKIVAAASHISESALDELDYLKDEIIRLKGLTVEDCFLDRRGEIEMISNTVSKIKAYVQETLDRYEQGL